MDWLLNETIGYLQSLQKMRAAEDVADFWQGFAFLCALVSSLALGAWGAIRWSASRGYSRGIGEKTKALRDLGEERTLRSKVESDVEHLNGQIAQMREDGPDGFMRRADIEERDGNSGQVARQARAFIDGQSLALRRAFAALARNEIAEGIEEGQPDFETARLYATAALSLDPQDRMARMYAEDMAYAKDMKMKGITVTLADNAEERLDARDRATTSVETAERYFFAARDAGRFRLMLDIVDHGEMLARRAFGKTARPTLKFRRHRAEALHFMGQSSIALDQLKALYDPLEVAFGEDDFETLYMRQLVASCLQSADRTSEALKKGEALLIDRMRILGAEHRETLLTRYLVASCLRDEGRTSEALKKGEVLLVDEVRVLGAEDRNALFTRYLIASCIRDTGRASEALEKGEALLPDDIRILGADHPHALMTRSLIAQCLLDLDRSQEAREIHAGVMEGLRAAGIVGDETRAIKRALEVDARLAAGAA